MRALEKRAVLESKKRSLDKRDNECFVDLVNVLPKKTNAATMVGQPKKRLNKLFLVVLKIIFWTQ